MAEQTGEEAKEQNITAMGEALGVQYTQLWQETAQLSMMWSEFSELFGTKLSRIELMNRSAGAFFRMVQDGIWEAIVLHIARLTDPSQSPGGKDRQNLTLHNLPGLIPDPKLKARDWRNRRITHRDLDLALGGTARPLPSVPIRQVNDAMKSFENILNAIALPYMNSTTSFDHSVRMNGAVELLYLLDDGHILRKQQRARLDAGEYGPDLFPSRDL